MPNTLRLPNNSPSIPGGKVALAGMAIKPVFLTVSSKGRKAIFSVSTFAKKLPRSSFPSISTALPSINNLLLVFAVIASGDKLFKFPDKLALTLT